MECNNKKNDVEELRNAVFCMEDQRNKTTAELLSCQDLFTKMETLIYYCYSTAAVSAEVTFDDFLVEVYNECDEDKNPGVYVKPSVVRRRTRPHRYRSDIKIKGTDIDYKEVVEERTCPKRQKGMRRSSP